jgi:hypothetical protein
VIIGTIKETSSNSVWKATQQQQKTSLMFKSCWFANRLDGFCAGLNKHAPFPNVMHNNCCYLYFNRLNCALAGCNMNQLLRIPHVRDIRSPWSWSKSIRKQCPSRDSMD